MVTCVRIIGEREGPENLRKKVQEDGLQKDFVLSRVIQHCFAEKANRFFSSKSERSKFLKAGNTYTFVPEENHYGICTFKSVIKYYTK